MQRIFQLFLVYYVSTYTFIIHVVFVVIFFFCYAIYSAQPQCTLHIGKKISYVLCNVNDMSTQLKNTHSRQIYKFSISLSFISCLFIRNRKPVFSK